VGARSWAAQPPSLSKMMSSSYELRTGVEGARNRKQSMAELKLRRLQELVQRLREDLDRRRIPVSEAAAEYVFFFHLSHLN
jgi:guanine nucleotide-binding protein subunit gamma